MWFISIFVATLLGWSAILWLALPLDIFRYSLTSIVAMHLAIPAGVVSCWMLVRRWLDAARQRKATIADASQRDIREAEKARQKHLFEEALKNRRISIDCRWAVTADVVFHGDNKPLTENTEQAANYFFTTVAPTVPSWPRNALIELLDDLFNAMPAAITLPIAICGPLDQAVVENESLIREVRQTVLARQQDDYSKLVSTDILQIADDGRGVYAAINDVFTRRRDWPAIVLIAFDNRIAAERDPFDVDTLDSSVSESEKWLGKAGRAISLMVLSQPELVDVLAKLEELGEGAPSDNLSPYWEKQKVPAGMAGHLTKWPRAWRDNFASMQPIAKLHRASFVDLPTEEPSSQHVKRTESAIIDAAINASLGELDFVFEGEVESMEGQARNRIGETAWLFHNAGDIGYCGDRMATMSLAMWQAGIELNPIDQATNAVMAIGDCGIAARYVWLALAIQRATQIGKPVLCVEWEKTELAIGFVAPYFRKN